MRLDLATRTLFAEFQETVFSRTALEKEIKDTGTFVRKRVKGGVYWYIQQYIDGVPTQKYFGPSNKSNDLQVEKGRQERQREKTLLRNLSVRESRQAAMLRRGGLPSQDPRIASVLSILSENRLIDKGGILIGTFAFMAYAGMLGEIFESGSLKTNDIDIVRNIQIATPATVNIDALLKRTPFDFHAVPGIRRGSLSSSFISHEGIRIDFLAPLKGRPEKVVPISGLKGAGAQPLPFLDFLIESGVRGVILYPKGGIAVSIPHPARFAIHKLGAASRRPSTESAKRAKDLNQASQLIRILAEEEPSELKSAWKAAMKYSKKWKGYIEASKKLLPAKTQEILNSL